MRTAWVVGACVGLAGLVTGCASIPRVELTAYTATYADVQVVTNGVLDIVAPYERIVIRYASRNTAQIVTVPLAVSRETLETIEPFSPNPVLVADTRMAQAAPDPSLLANPNAARPAPAPDPALLADPNAARPARPAPAPDPSLLARPARPAPAPDPSLLARPARPAPAPDPSLLARPARPAPAPDPSLLARRARPAAQPDPSLLAGGTRPAPAGTVAVGRPCRGFGGPDPYCYEMRDGYADIGDPPLVAAYRNLANVVLRFNTLLVAYSEGISGRLLRQELDGLASSVSEISKVVPITGISGAGAFFASFQGVVSSLLPIADLAGGVIDRTQLRTFLLDNYAVVDEAILLMARNSSVLYSNVASGTQLYQIKVRGVGETLNTRRREIRRLIANWTVLLDDTRRVLRELKIAVESSDGLETRIRNLDSTVTARIDTSAIKKQIATLGTPVLPP